MPSFWVDSAIKYLRKDLAVCQHLLLKFLVHFFRVLAGFVCVDCKWWSDSEFSDQLFGYVMIRQLSQGWRNLLDFLLFRRALKELENLLLAHHLVSSLDISELLHQGLLLHSKITLLLNRPLDVHHLFLISIRMVYRCETRLICPITITQG